MYNYSKNQGSGQQCCYFSDGTLIVGVPNGGNADMIASQNINWIL